jgi:hypothetical protein
MAPACVVTCHIGSVARSSTPATNRLLNPQPVDRVPHVTLALLHIVGKRTHVFELSNSIPEALPKRICRQGDEHPEDDHANSRRRRAAFFLLPSLIRVPPGVRVRISRLRARSRLTGGSGPPNQRIYRPAGSISTRVRSTLRPHTPGTEPPTTRARRQESGWGVGKRAQESATSSRRLERITSRPNPHGGTHLGPGPI